MGEISVKDYIEERVMELAHYIIENKSTVRATAKRFNVSKSTVHKDVSERLLRLNPVLSKSVRSVLNENKSERHIRGGQATRDKYMKLHKTDKYASPGQ